MDAETRDLKTRQLQGFKAREEKCPDTLAAIARLEAELAGPVDDQVVVGSAAQLRAELVEAVARIAELELALKTEAEAHEVTRQQLATAIAAHAPKAPARRAGAKRSAR